MAYPLLPTSKAESYPAFIQGSGDSLSKDYVAALEYLKLSHMTRKQIGHNTGNSGRINVPGSELEKLGLEIGDDVEVEVADTKEVAHALIDSTDSDEFLIGTPA